MPDDFFATGREYVPPKSDFKARLAGGPPLFQHGRHCRCKGRFRVTQICRDESQQVVGSGSQRACSRKRRQVPILNGFERGVVSSCEPPFHFGRERDTRAVHTQRSADSRLDEILVTHSSAQGESMPQKSASKVGILILRTDVPGKLVRGEKFIELLNRIIRIGIVRILGRHICGQSRQAGRVRGEIDGRNRTPVPLRHFCAGRQILNYRIAQRDFAALRHVGQQQCREHLRCRANFEYRVAVERTWIVLLQMPIGITRRPAGPMTPTTMPTLWCWRSIRSTSICRISASDGVVVFGGDWPSAKANMRSEEHTSELQSRLHLVCRLLLEKKKKKAWTNQQNILH